jgi:3',5'-cyclic AMP phosphodiesterase CpdA
MRVVAHISDLHFGRTDAVLVRRLKAQLNELKPDLTIISGDLTQRARISEFTDARAFLDSLPKPQIAVPGNHDIELYNLYGRFVERLQRYRYHICPDVEPHYLGSDLTVVSLNTARSLTFKGGRVNRYQVERLKQTLVAAPSNSVKILVGHHPLDLPAGFDHPLAGRSRAALKALADSGLDLILSGHLHVPQLTAPAERLRVGGHTAILVQAGSAISTRHRGEGNSYNVIEASKDSIVVHQRAWSAGEQDFSEVRTVAYHRSPTGWQSI